MNEYLRLLNNVLYNGEKRTDRTGTGTKSVFSPAPMSFNLAEGFPLVTTKKVFWRGVVVELLWMLSGSTNIKPLVDQNVSIWTDWPLKYRNSIHDYSPMTKEDFETNIRTDEKFAEYWGKLGPVYGHQWRNLLKNNRGREAPVKIDQLADARKLILNNPDSRRIIVNSWNVQDIPDMLQSGLPPCHCFYQFYCSSSKKQFDTLDMVIYIRSDSERLH